MRCCTALEFEFHNPHCSSVLECAGLVAAFGSSPFKGGYIWFIAAQRCLCCFSFYCMQANSWLASYKAPAAEWIEKLLGPLFLIRPGAVLGTF
jgi:hypothetical protein